jgi:hypothetical protein
MDREQRAQSCRNFAEAFVLSMMIVGLARIAARITHALPIVWREIRAAERAKNVTAPQDVASTLFWAFAICPYIPTRAATRAM